jgi:hypothetical protein
MNAFDKINPETSDLLEGEVIIAEAPKVPAKPATPTRDSRIPEGAEVVKAEIVYGSCHYYALVSNKDGSKMSRQHVDNNVQSKWGAGFAEGSRDFFIARHNGMSGPSSSSFEFLSGAPADLRW